LYGKNSIDANHFQDNLNTVTGPPDEPEVNLKQDRYYKNSSKSIDTRSRTKNSYSQKKPPTKSRRQNMNYLEKPLSVDNKSDGEKEPEPKIKTPEGQWK
jgi:hypothetical protein